MDELKGLIIEKIKTAASGIREKTTTTQDREVAETIRTLCMSLSILSSVRGDVE